MKMHWAYAAILASSLGAMLGSVQAGARDMTPGLFDNPLKTVTTMAYDLPSQRKITVTCFYYRHVAIKEVHFEDDEGAAIFAAAMENGKEPPCDVPKETDHKSVRDLDGWLDGVTNDLVITVDPDTINNGTGFTIYRPLDDRIIFSSDGMVDDKFRLRLKLIQETKAGVLIRYDRVFVGPCSVAGQGEACFEKFVRQTGIDKRSFNKCAAMTGAKFAREKDVKTDPTVMAFDVQVFIPANKPFTGQGEVQNTTIGSLINCYPAE